MFRVRQRREPRGYVALVFSHPGSICCLGFPTFRHTTRSKSKNLETSGVIVLSSAHRSVPPLGIIPCARRTSRLLRLRIVLVSSCCLGFDIRWFRRFDCCDDCGVALPPRSLAPDLDPDLDTKLTTPLLSPEADEVESLDRKKFVPRPRTRLTRRKCSL